MNIFAAVLFCPLFCTIVAASPEYSDTTALDHGDSSAVSLALAPLDTLRHALPPSITIGENESPSQDLSRPLASIDQQTQSPKTLWIFNRKTLALGSTLAFSIPIVAVEYQWWWRSDFKSQKHGFLINNEGWFDDYSMGVDKAGHFFTSYLFFRTFYDLMKWADYSESTSMLTAFAVPAAHAISVELCDGYSKYGFSFYDLTSNFLGMGYAFAQIEVPYLRNFNFKWSYYKTPTGIIGDDRGFAADYTGHTYWMSVNMKNVLPEEIGRYWPKYLNLAVGYGASNVSAGEDRSLARHKFAFSLDYNLGAIPVVDDTWAMLLRFADKFHYPAPGIKVYSGGEAQAKPLLLY